MNTGTGHSGHVNQLARARSQPDTEPGQGGSATHPMHARLQQDTGRAILEPTPIEQVPAPTNLSSPINADAPVSTVSCTECDLTVQARRSRKSPEAQLFEHWEIFHNPQRRHNCEV